MALEVIFRPEAEADLVGLYEYIAEHSGYRIAGGYIERIEEACMALATFPKRGTRRDEFCLAFARSGSSGGSPSRSVS